jgi:hypothetical protein
MIVFAVKTKRLGFVRVNTEFLEFILWTYQNY